MRPRLMLLVWVVVFSTALVSRAPSLIGRSFWIDEIITRKIAQLPLWKPGAMNTTERATHSIVGFCLHDAGPGPLTYMTEGVFASRAELFGGEFWIRIPGIIAGILTLCLILRRGRHWCGGRYGALLMAAVAAVYPDWVDWSTAARGYAWVTLLALLQWDYVLRSAVVARKEGAAMKNWVVLCLLSCLALLFHQVHVLWSSLVFCVFLGMRFMKKPSAAKRLQVRPIVIGLIIVTAVHFIWLYAWRHGLQMQGEKFVEGVPWQEVRRKFLFALGQTREQVPIVVCLLIVLVGGVLLSKRSMPLPVRALPFAALLAGVVLYGVLVTRFFPSMRYFYAISVVALWVIGCLGQQLWNWSARVFAVRAVMVALPLVLPVLFFRPALLAAATPVQDWAGTVLWLKKNAKPGDLVLCGPNADVEVFIPYAKAARLQATATRYVKGDHEQVFDAFAEPGLRELLSSQKRVWFVTPFFGVQRTPGYWRLVNLYFKDVASIPGKGNIRVMLRVPDR